MADKPETTGTDPKPDPDKPKDTGKDLEAEVEKWKALSRKHETNAKTNADAAKRLAELEDADKSALQKLTDKVAEAEQRAEAADARALRFEVASSKGLSGSQAKRLIGSTKEELEADADDILESFKPAGDDDKGDGGGPRRRPTENLRGGGGPDDEPTPDIRKVVEEIPRGGI